MCVWERGEGKGCVCERVCATGGRRLVLQSELILHCTWGCWNLLWGEFVCVCGGGGKGVFVCVCVCV